MAAAGILSRHYGHVNFQGVCDEGSSGWIYFCETEIEDSVKKDLAGIGVHVI